MFSELKLKKAPKGWVLKAPLYYSSNTRTYKEMVPGGFFTDLASIPWIFRWYVNNSDPEIRAPAVLHDFLCVEANKHKAVAARRAADLRFRSALIEEGVRPAKAEVMYCFVSLYSTYRIVRYY